MEDVARVAGVSVATVSKVVNQRYGVAQGTFDKVTEVIESLGYEASLGARSLRSHSTNVIGVLVAEFEPFSTELLKGVSSAIDETGYELLAYSGGHHGRSVGWERRSLSRLGGTLIDGAILVTPTVVRRRPASRSWPSTRTPGRPACRPSTPTTWPGRCSPPSTCWPWAIGASRCSAAAPDLESARLREQGFRSAMAAAGVPVDEALVRVGGYRPETATAPAQGAADPARPPDRRFRRQRPLRDPHHGGGPRAGPARARGPVGRRLRQRARVRAVQPAPDDHRRSRCTTSGPPPCACSSRCWPAASRARLTCGSPRGSSTATRRDL